MEERAQRWRWWHRQTPLTRKIIRTAVLLVLTGLLAAGVGVSTASTRSSLGPHEADYSVTLGGQVTVQLGPFGALMIDSPLPGPLGVDVVVREIPADIETVMAGDSPVPGLLADLGAYGQLFTHPDATVADAARGLVSDALGRTAVAWSLLLVLIAAGRLAASGHLRDEVARALARPGVPALAAAVALTATSVVVVPAVMREEPAGYSPAVLDGTPLEGAVITGRLADLVAVYGRQLRDLVEENDAFYARAAENLALALDEAPEPPEHRPQERLPGPEEATHPEEGEPPLTEDETPQSVEDLPALDEDDLATGPPEELPEDSLAAEPPAIEWSVDEAEVDPVTFLLVADLHCNIGMSAVIGAAAEHSGAAAILDAGDTVASGTSVESYCVDAVAGAVPESVPYLWVNGNHDSVLTTEQVRSAGWRVLEGEPIEVEGIRFLGDSDPRLTVIGQGTRFEREESVAETGQRLGAQACELAAAGDRVDVMLVHSPAAGVPALDHGCAPLLLAGHLHRTEGPDIHGAGVRYVSTSSGGGAGGGATIGPLTSDAEVTLVRIDRVTGLPLDYQRVVIDTAGEVELLGWQSFPTPDGEQDEDEGEDDAPAGDGGDE